MIALKKLRPPQEAVEWLDRMRAEFQARFDDEAATKADYNRYRDARVKAALLLETNAKCAYCEVSYTPFAWGDVEHILPKSKNPRDRTLDYRNLTLVCCICNGTKSDIEYPPPDNLINPYEDEPGNYLWCSGPYLMPSTDLLRLVRGHLTIESIGLNRPALVERRFNKLNECHHLAVMYKNAANDGIRAYALGLIDTKRSPREEFSFFATDFFARCGL